jgi:hypothetical protein
MARLHFDFALIPLDEFDTKTLAIISTLNRGLHGLAQTIIFAKDPGAAMYRHLLGIGSASTAFRCIHEQFSDADVDAMLVHIAGSYGADGTFCTVFRGAYETRTACPIGPTPQCVRASLEQHGFASTSSLVCVSILIDAKDKIPYNRITGKRVSLENIVTALPLDIRRWKRDVLATVYTICRV